MRLCKLNPATPALAVTYAFIISAGAAANIWINHVAKGSWDFYPVAEMIRVLCSLFILLICGTTRGLMRMSYRALPTIPLAFRLAWRHKRIR